MKLKVGSLLLGIVFVVCTFGASDSQASIKRSYILNDHPGGSENPPPYGLRLDGLAGTTGVVTFSFDGESNSDVSDPGFEWKQMRLDYYDNGDVHIFGNIYGGEVNESSREYEGNFGTFELDYWYYGATEDGDKLTADVGSSNGAGDFNGGSLTAIDIDNGSFTNSDSFSLIDKAKSGTTQSFLFDSDGHRLTGDSTTFVGRGWHRFATSSDGNSNASGYRDFLFTANAVPEPTTLVVWSMLGLGCIGVSRRRKS